MDDLKKPVSQGEDRIQPVGEEPDGTPPTPGPSDEPEWRTWSENVFDLHQAPFGAMWEPEGYTEMRARGRRTVADYAKLMPMTTRLASVLFDSVVYPEVWGEHRETKKVAGVTETEAGYIKPKADVSWKTSTAGKWVPIAGKWVPIKQVTGASK